MQAAKGGFYCQYDMNKIFVYKNKYWCYNVST